jgi:hypothetical protein
MTAFVVALLFAALMPRLARLMLRTPGDASDVPDARTRAEAIVASARELMPTLDDAVCRTDATDVLWAFVSQTAGEPVSIVAVVQDSAAPTPVVEGFLDHECLLLGLAPDLHIADSADLLGFVHGALLVPGVRQLVVQSGPLFVRLELLVGRPFVVAHNVLSRLP